MLISIKHFAAEKRIDMKNCTDCTECKLYKKSPAIANGNAQQPRWMFESPVKQSLSQSPEVVRRPAGGYSVYSVLLVLTRGRNVFRSANTVSAGYRKFFLPPLI